jgi:formylglycine-generating enzyme required for sulfatase activity
LGAFVLRWRDPDQRALLDAVLDKATPDVPVPIPVLSDMACFTGVRIRAGAFDASQRPLKCSALNPTEDCMHPQALRLPEVALANFCLDKHEVTNQEFASWLEGTPEMWRLNSKDPAVIQTRTKPRVFLVRTGEECSLTLVDGRVRTDPGKAKQPVVCVTWLAA